MRDKNIQLGGTSDVDTKPETEPVTPKDFDDGTKNRRGKADPFIRNLLRRHLEAKKKKKRKQVKLPVDVNTSGEFPNPHESYQKRMDECISMRKHLNKLQQPVTEAQVRTIKKVLYSRAEEIRERREEFFREGFFSAAGTLAKEVGKEAGHSALHNISRNAGISASAVSHIASKTASAFRDKPNPKPKVKPKKKIINAPAADVVKRIDRSFLTDEFAGTLLTREEIFETLGFFKSLAFKKYKDGDHEHHLDKVVHHHNELLAAKASGDRHLAKMHHSSREHHLKAFAHKAPQHVLAKLKMKNLKAMMDVRAD